MWANLMLLFGIVAVATAVVCQPEICRRVRCANVPCGEDEILIKNGGVCGCCDICVGPYCGPNEIYSQCVNVCNECQYINVTCNFLVCNKGCDCQPGYTRNDQRICIPEYMCPRDTCGPNSKLSNCASMCPPTCRNPDRICIQACAVGCVCDPGFVLDDFGNCIPKGLCPRYGEGEPCSPNSGGRECGYGLICDTETNTCQKIFPFPARAWLSSNVVTIVDSVF